MAYKKSTNRFPVEYQKMQNTISQISQNKALPAFEREQQIHDYIANEAKKVGAPPELTQVENIAVLTDYYKVKAHVDKIRNTPDNEITAPTSGDILWPNPLPGTDPRVPSSTSGQGEMMRSTAPTNSVEISFLSPNGSYDEAQMVKWSVLRKAEAIGILDVKFVINHQIGGVSHTGYIGRVRQEDGSYVLQALNLQPVKGK
jgi:SOS-response transcriptional repressor LexA